MKTRNEKLNRRDKSAAALSAAVDRRSMIAAVSDSRTPSTNRPFNNVDNSNQIVPVPWALGMVS